MFRIFAAASLGLAAIAALPTTVATAHERGHSGLDDGQPLAREWVSTSRFEAVVLAGPDAASVTHGERWQIRASGDPKVLAELRFVVEDGKLTVGRRHRHERVDGTARIEITAPAVENVVLAGSGTLAIESMSGAEVSATVAGSGTMDIGRVRASEIKATIAGSGDLRIPGQADSGSITVAGSGDIDGSDLLVGRAAVSIAGWGDARFHAAGKVTASIVGSGNAVVFGTNDCTQTRMGSGRLTCSR